MFQIFSFNFDGLNNKNNSTKFLAIGYTLVVLGILSFIYKGIGIKLVSWLLASSLLFVSYLNLKNINELRRYASKEEISPYTRTQAILLVTAGLLFFFPERIQSLVSSLVGIYIIYSQIKKYIVNKNNPYYRFGFGSIIISLIGLTLIFSPLFLSRFIVSFMSLIVVLIGINLVSLGNKFKSQ